MAAFGQCRGDCPQPLIWRRLSPYKARKSRSPSGTFSMTSLDKIIARQAVIGIIGLGYVGIPLALRFSSAGFRVLGFDIDADRVRTLNAGKSPIAHIPAGEVAGMVKAGFEA